MNPVSEQIDERILRLLGLQQVFDLDYGTYETLLKEAIVSGARRLPQEELALLSNERKRIRGKKGRLKPKSKPITASSLATTKFLNPVVQPISSPIVPAQSQISAEKLKPVDLSPLQEPLRSIQTTLGSLLSLRKGSEEQDRKDYEQENRKKREEGLESVKRGFGTVQNAVQKFISPFQNIIDNIMRFIFFTLLGKAFNDLMNWLSDPKNKSRVQTLTRFFKDWWPTLVGAAVLFLTPFGAFVRGILRMVGGLTGRLISQIPRILNATKSLGLAFLRNPWLAAGAAAVAGTAYVISQMNKQESPSPSVPIQGSAKGGPVLPLMSLLPLMNRPIFPMANGGMTGYGGIYNNTGHRISGFGVDTQLIAARPGEIVINKETVDAVGAEPFLYLNQQYGGPGANKPKMGRLFAGGGIVGGYPIGTNQFGEIPLIREALRSGIKGNELAAFLAQVSHETGGFRWSRELGKGRGMGYSGGDQYYGRGYIQVTHDYNYRDLGKKLGLNLLKNPDLLLRPDVASKAEVMWWMDNVRPKVKNWNDVFQVSAAVNYPAASSSSEINGYEDRVQRFNYYASNISQIVKRGSEIKGTAKPKPGSESKSTTKPKEKEKAWWDPLGLFSGGKEKPEKKQGGGSLIPITSDFGFPIKGMGPDTQYDPTTNTALQPGEKIFNYVLTKDSANKGLGNVLLSVANTLQAGFDNDSNAADFIKNKIKTPANITPHPAIIRNTIEMLPPITQSASGVGAARGGTGGPQVPVFSARHPSANNASLYGIG